jgi:hypothetical protein
LCCGVFESELWHSSNAKFPETEPWYNGETNILYIYYTTSKDLLKETFERERGNVTQDERGCLLGSVVVVVAVPLKSHAVLALVLRW